MFLKSINLHNFRNHRKLELNFNEGITGIVGPNGAGKSTIIEAILFLLFGETFDSKDDVIMKGCATGYVSGLIDLNDKEAYLERHLDSSKVLLKYDGKVYKKSTEVKELWNSLFQINADVFKKVILAAQGEIPLLFSGDNSVREKIFQKIFLVPNTNKYRDILWQYIKECPPPKDEQDVELLKTQRGLLEQQLSDLMAAQDKLNSLYDEEAYGELVARKQFVEKAIRDLEMCKIFARDEAQTTQEKIDLELKSSNAAALVRAIDATTIEEDYQKASRLFEVRRQLNLIDVSELVAGVKQKDELNLLEQEIAKLTVKLQGYAEKVADLEMRYYKIVNLRETEPCPTCGSVLENFDAAKAHLRQEIATTKQHIVTDAAIKQKREAEVKRSRDHHHLYLTKSAKLKALQDEEAHLVKTLADPVQTIDDYSKYKKAKEIIAKTQSDILTCMSVLARIKSRQAELTVYDKLEEPTVELNEVVKELQKMLLVKNQLTDLQVKAAQCEMSLTMTTQQIVGSQRAKAFNAKRTHYLEVLNNVYNGFHTSKFPRLLIQSYTTDVEENLGDILNTFNFPYSVKLNDQFGLDVYDEDGNVLPRLSGGQEIIVGLSLRLSLHRLFGQAFPMLIIDEGTTHLDEANRSLYFELIKTLKHESTLKQIIIIDHDNQLLDVVDNTVKIQKYE